MPQTREHLAILDLLQVPGGVIVLTKTDLVDDAEFIDLVEDDVRRAVQNTVLAEAELVRVSARKRQGLEELQLALMKCLAGRPPRTDAGKPRLPVDRVFTIAGFGTVVTGTLLDGHLNVEDEVEILPQGLRGRVRGLQSHKKKTEQALPGSRTAVNIAGLNVAQIQRGNVVTHPGDYQPSTLLDVRFRLLADASHPLKHNAEVKLFIGAAETLSRVRLIGAEALAPGESGWLQLELAEPITTTRGDRYILRRPSPAETIGGGEVLDAQPRRQYKRFSPTVLARFESLSEGDAAELIWQALVGQGAAIVREVVAACRLDVSVAGEAIQRLVHEGRLIVAQKDAQQINWQESNAANTLLVARNVWDRTGEAMLQTVRTYHRTHPLRQGISREELKNRLKGTPRVFSARLEALCEEGLVVDRGGFVQEKGHKIQFNAEQQARVNALLSRFAAARFNPPTIKECVAEVGEEVYAVLVNTGELMPVSAEVVFRFAEYQELREKVIQHLTQHGVISVAEGRDLFNTSRRYVLAMLEHLDASGVTRRDGDVRRLRNQAGR